MDWLHRGPFDPRPLPQNFSLLQLTRGELDVGALDIAVLVEGDDHQVSPILADTLLDDCGLQRPGLCTNALEVFPYCRQLIQA